MAELIPIIAIGGGPCSGKTTGLVKITERLQQLGYVVGIVPETATALISNGISFKTLGNGREFQEQLVRMQLFNEHFLLENMRKVAKHTGKRAVLLTDRGLLTGAAYLSGTKDLVRSFQSKILKRFDLTAEKIISQYAGIVHLVTAADGAEEYYTTANNNARTETPEEARLLDLRTQHAWLSHPYLRIVPNLDKHGRKITFEQKTKHFISEILHMLGYPEPLELEDSYEVGSFTSSALKVQHAQEISIEQTYLLSPDPNREERVRIRNYLGGRSYVHTKKMDTPDGKGRFEVEHPISGEAFRAFLHRADPDCNTIKKIRHCFLYKNQYFELDVFSGHNKGLVKLEREKTKANDTTALPPFIKIKQEVTGNKAFSNRMLALKKR